MEKKFLGREKELAYLKEFTESKSSGFMYVRGRRRVGKSLLLLKFSENIPECFYFMGAKDATDQSVKEDFAVRWDRYVGALELSHIKKSMLTWSEIFKVITEYVKNSHKQLILIFDEIQWIAKTGSGFIGNLKEAWLHWQQTGLIKVVVCGSSNKFFTDTLSGALDVLRGIVTYGTLWVPPFSLNEIKTYYFPEWSLEEIALTYMMFGGIPYYLEQLEDKKGFIHAINEAVFTHKTIFINEVDEILKLEFNQAGKEHAKSILGHLGQNGRTQEILVKKTGLPQSTVSGLVSKLQEYGIVFQKYPAHISPARRGAGIFYYMKDFYLNFYFQIIEPLLYRIRNNKSGLLFSYECIGSNEGYYIPHFSGSAFERLARYILETRTLAEKIFKKLQLVDGNYRVETYWDKHTQLDIIVEHQKDRIARILECKWITNMPRERRSFIKELCEKHYPAPTRYLQKRFFILSQKCTEGFIDEATKQDVGIIYLEDLF